MLTINGALGEGGGQIVRTAICLSAITNTAFRITQIRANRPKPGLAAQHLSACQAAAEITQAEIIGAEIGSRELEFKPKRIQAGNYYFNIGTAGAVTLLAQTIIPILLHATRPSHVRIIGGTHVYKSPGYDYFEQVFLPAITRFGCQINSKLLRIGFYPKGGGEIELSISPSKLTGVMNWQHATHKNALIRLANLPAHIAEREKYIFETAKIDKITIEKNESYSSGNSVTLWQGFRGAYVIGERGKRAEVVANEAVTLLAEETGDVDHHLADQLLIYAVMAKGETQYRTSYLSNHLHTNVHVIKQFFRRSIELKDHVVVIV